MPGRTVSILLIEDDEIDQMTIKRAFDKQKIANPLFIARDGVEGLEYLRGENGKEILAHPILILLDLNMPRMNGLEFLIELRKDSALKSTVVFVLTTSNADQDRCRAYAKCISGYMVKSDVGHDFPSVATMLDAYWRVVEFP